MSRVKPFISEVEESTMVAQRIIPYCRQKHRKNLVCIQDFSEEPIEGNNNSKTFLMFSKTDAEDPKSPCDAVRSSRASDKNSNDIDTSCKDIDEESKDEEKEFEAGHNRMENVSVGTRDLIHDDEIKDDENESGKDIDGKGCKSSQQSAGASKTSENEEKASIEKQEYFAILINRPDDNANDEASQTLVLSNGDEYKDEMEDVKEGNSEEDCTVWSVCVENAPKSDVHDDMHERLTVKSCDINAEAQVHDDDVRPVGTEFAHKESDFDLNVVDKTADLLQVPINQEDSESDTVEYLDDGIQSDSDTVEYLDEGIRSVEESEGKSENRLEKKSAAHKLQMVEKRNEMDIESDAVNVEEGAGKIHKASEIETRTEMDIEIESDQMYVKNDQVNVESDQVNVASDQVNVASDQANVETDQMNAASDQVNDESDQVNVESEQVNVKSDLVNVASDQVNVASDQANVETDQMNAASDQVNDESDQVNVESDQVNAASDQVNASSDKVNVESDQVNFDSERKTDIPNEIDTRTEVDVESESKTDPIVENARNIDTVGIMREVLESTFDKIYDSASNKNRMNSCRTDESEIVNIEDNKSDIEQSVAGDVTFSGSPQMLHRIVSENDRWRQGGAKVPYAWFEHKMELDEKPKVEILDDEIKSYEVNTEHCSNTADKLNEEPQGLTLYRNVTTVDTDTLGNKKDKSQTDERRLENAIADDIVNDLPEIQGRNSDIETQVGDRDTQKQSVDDQVRIEDQNEDDVMVTGFSAPKKNKTPAHIKEPSGVRRSCRYKANIMYAESDPESDHDDPFVIRDDDIMSHPRKRRRMMESQGNGAITERNRHHPIPHPHNPYSSQSFPAPSWRANVQPMYGAYPQIHHALYGMPQRYPRSTIPAHTQNRAPLRQLPQPLRLTTGSNSQDYRGSRIESQTTNGSNSPLPRPSTPRDSIELLSVKRILNQQSYAGTNQRMPVSVNHNNQHVPSAYNQSYSRPQHQMWFNPHNQGVQNLPRQRMPNPLRLCNTNPEYPRYPYQAKANHHLPYTPNQQGTAQSTFQSNAIASANSTCPSVSNAVSVHVTSASKDVQVLTPDVGNYNQVTAGTGICHDTNSPTTTVGHLVPSTQNLDLQSTPSRANLDLQPLQSTANLDLQAVSSTANPEHRTMPVHMEVKTPSTRQQMLSCDGTISKDVSKDSQISEEQTNCVDLCNADMIISPSQEHASITINEDLPSHIILAEQHGINCGFHPYSYGDTHLDQKTQWVLERCFFVKLENVLMADERAYVEHCQRTMIAMFICNICGGIFESDKALHVHKQVTLECLSHSQDLFHVICKVNKQSGEKSDVISPLVKIALNRTNVENTANTEGCMFACKCCPASFTSIGDAIVHVGRVHLRCPYMYCHLCGSVLCSKELFVKHLIKFHAQTAELASQILPCHCCYKNFNSEMNLREHYRKTHKDPFLCKICNKQMLSVEQLLEHLLLHCDHNKPTLTQCPVCGNAYDFRFFGNHILAKHTNSDVNNDSILHKCQSIMVKCDFCDRIFTEREIMTHRLNGNCRNVVITMNANSIVRQWACKKCKVTTNSFYEWRQHTSMFHADWCGSSSKILEGVKRSVVWPLKNRKDKIQCLICCEEVDSNTELFKSHLRLHLDTSHISNITSVETTNSTLSVAHASVSRRSVRDKHPVIVQQDTSETSNITAASHRDVRGNNASIVEIVEKRTGKHMNPLSHDRHPGEPMTKEQTLTYMNVSAHYAKRMLGRTFGQESVKCDQIAHNKNLHVILDKRVFCERFKVADDFHACSICGGIFYDESSLAKHMEDVKTQVRHPQDAFHFIQQVDDDGLLTPVTSKLVSVIAGTFDENSVQDQSASDELNKYKCKTCECDFSSLAEAITHVGRFHFSCPYMFCNLCGTVLSDPITFANHTAKFHAKKVNEHRKIIPCPACPENFTDRKQCLEHIKKHHSNINLTCSLCKYAATSRQQIAYHMIEHDIEDFATVVCPVCGVSMYYHLLGDHVLNTHSQIWGLEQPLPKFPQMTFSEMRRDIRIKCGICDSPYMLLKELKDHRMNHECPELLAGSRYHERSTVWVCKKCEKNCGKTFHDWRIHVTMEHADLCYFASQRYSVEDEGSRSSPNPKHNVQELVSDPNVSGTDEDVTPAPATVCVRGNNSCVAQNSSEEITSLQTDIAQCSDEISPPRTNVVECSEMKMTGVESAVDEQCNPLSQKQNTEASDNKGTLDCQKDANTTSVNHPNRRCDSPTGENSGEVPYNAVFKIPALWPVLMHMQPKYSCKGQCIGCGLILANDRRRGHTRNHLRRGNAAYREKDTVVCEICGKSTGRSYLEKHLKSHSEGTSRTPCEICGEMVVDIKRHMSKHAQKSAPQECFCPYCHKRYASTKCLTRHIRTIHYGAKPKHKHIIKRMEHSCPMCPWKSFTTKVIYKVHINTHTKEKQYKCDICSKEFCNQMVLSTHKKVHEERKHECPEEGCGLKFRQKCTLTRHLVTHSKEKPYKCQWCANSFAQSYPLSLHVKKKHKKHYEKFLAADGKRRIRKDRFGPDEKDQD